MTILDRLIDAVADIPVRNVLVGCFTTLVAAGERCGLASTLKPPSHTGHGISDPKQVPDATLRQLAARARSDNLLDASLGMAALHAGTMTPALPWREVNARELLAEKGNGNVLGMIGHFPFIDRVRDRFRKTLVFELEPQEHDLPASQIADRLPEADVVAVTATTLTNHTFETVMAAVRKDAWVVMLGPTTPLHPMLFEAGVDAISGSLVVDETAVFQLASLGTPFRHLQGIRHVTVLREDIA